MDADRGSAWTDTDIDTILEDRQHVNRQLRHLIYTHELLVIANTPAEHKGVAMEVAKEKLRQTFRKAVNEEAKTLSGDARYWFRWGLVKIVFRRILANRVKRLKARWTKAKIKCAKLDEGPLDTNFSLSAIRMGLVA